MEINWPWQKVGHLSKNYLPSCICIASGPENICRSRSMRKTGYYLALVVVIQFQWILWSNHFTSCHQRSVRNGQRMIVFFIINTGQSQQSAQFVRRNFHRSWGWSRARLGLRKCSGGGCMKCYIPFYLLHGLVNMPV
jgi:hypothetical protein